MRKETEILVGMTPAQPETIADLARRMLTLLGEDPQREGLRHTPERYEKALRFLTSGYSEEPREVLNGAMFSVCYDEMVVVKDIEVYSLCEHHLLPFFGKCHVAYIPDKKVVGLSKIAAPGEHVCAPAADSGAAHAADCPRRAGAHQPAGSGRGGRGAPSLHGHARGGEAAFRGGHQRHAGSFPRQQNHALGISFPGEQRKIMRFSLQRV